MWPLDNIVYNDFASWKMENINVIEQLKTNKSIIYDRLEPVYEVLNHIYDMKVEKQEVDEDLDVIFNVGFNYLHTQFEMIRIYFETLFQSNCDDFVHYSEMILYLLYIFDIKSDLENNGINSDIPDLNELEINIENMIVERREDHLLIHAKINETFATVYDLMGYEYVSIIDVFVEIAENLGIFIFDDEEILIGKDI